MTVQPLTPRGNASRFIAVEGPIGVGKTALARRLAESLSAELVLEEVEENPFLERFYREGKRAALPAQMFFLFALAIKGPIVIYIVTVVLQRSEGFAGEEDHIVVTAGVPFNVPGSTNILRVAPCDERLIFASDPE